MLMRLIQNLQQNEEQIAFSEKLKNEFVNADGNEVDLPSEIIEIYSYRNGIHIIAEQRRGINYELNLSKRAYRRMKSFIDQLKEKAC